MRAVSIEMHLSLRFQLFRSPPRRQLDNISPRRLIETISQNPICWMYPFPGLSDKRISARTKLSVFRLILSAAHEVTVPSTPWQKLAGDCAPRRHPTDSNRYVTLGTYQWTITARLQVGHDVRKASSILVQHLKARSEKNSSDPYHEE